MDNELTLLIDEPTCISFSWWYAHQRLWIHKVLEAMMAIFQTLLKYTFANTGKEINIRFC